MLVYNEIKPKCYIIHEGEPYEVLESHVFRKQQRKPVNATKMKNLITGRIVEYSFHQSEKVDEAELDIKKIKYLYQNKGEWWFCEENDPSKRFKLNQSEVGETSKFLKVNSFVDLVSFEGKLIGLRYPIKVELKVKEAAPGVRGDTARGGMKQIVLESGATINAPLFVNEGDTVVINTETGQYVERK